MTYTTEGRICVAKIDGQTYRIPDIWLVGATRGGRTIDEAVAVWHEQAQLEAQWNREHERS